MASGIGPSNITQLLFFLDLPNCKNLNSWFFKNTELTIGSTLRKVALESMEEVTEEEVRLTINNEEQQTQFNKRNLSLGISVSFEIGWNKRSYGNRYDSLSGHALIIGCLSNKIIPGVFSSKISQNTSAPETMTAHLKRLKQTRLSTSIKKYLGHQISERFT